MDLLHSLLQKWQSKTPSLVKWILFLPLSAVITTILFLPLYLVILLLGFTGGLSITVYSIIWQVNYLVLIFYFVPKKPILFLWIIISLRVIFLIVFIVGFVISIYSSELEFFEYREFVTEILILLSSLYLIKIYKNFDPNEQEGLATVKYSLGFSIYVIILLIILLLLSFLSDVPYIGWIFRIIGNLIYNG